MSKAVQTLEETLPRDALYAEALRHRLSIRHWARDRQVQLDAQAWLSGSGIEFGALAVLGRLNPASTATFESYLNAAHVLAGLAKAMPGTYPMEGVHAYLKRQAQFAGSHGIVSWVVAIDIARTLLYQAARKQEAALETLRAAISAAAPTGIFRIFVDECDSLGPLLEELKPRLRDEALIVYASHLLEALEGGSAKPAAGDRHEALLSERELEVLQYLARGLSYEEIGRQLFLSLNTIQFHVKNIYRKLLVNKRVLAIEKAREMKLI
jgi:LuxR family maltose regulon positive regulatory protein